MVPASLDFDFVAAVDPLDFLLTDFFLTWFPGFVVFAGLPTDFFLPADFLLPAGGFTGLFEGVCCFFFAPFALPFFFEEFTFAI